MEGCNFGLRLISFVAIFVFDMIILGLEVERLDLAIVQDACKQFGEPGSDGVPFMGNVELWLHPQSCRGILYCRCCSFKNCSEFVEGSNVRVLQRQQSRRWMWILKSIDKLLCCCYSGVR